MIQRVAIIIMVRSCLWGGISPSRSRVIRKEMINNVGNPTELINNPRTVKMDKNVIYSSTPIYLPRNSSKLF